jgi:lipopolysaccharide/colanic/teichoic acid biosynthesis glycosyltransferase
MKYETAKRILDIFMAIILLIVFAPVFILAPILIKLDSPGPVFADIPQRVGKDKKFFRMYKFRTMIANAHQLLRTDPKFRHLYEEYKKHSYKLREDPRITRVGKVLRRFSLDELPQVFNILKGEMSIVGPRAYYPDELEEQQKVYPESKKYVKELLKIKPGITGYWQVHGRSEINFDKRVKMDAYYARQRSILQDIIIILKTPWIMISGKGAL